MKKHPFAILLVITCIFAAFTLGFLVGRNSNHETVQLSSLPAVPQHNSEEVTVPSDETTVPEVIFPININSATVYELSQLPGIGETLGQRIVDYRTLNGDFAAPEDLLNVNGIGTGKLEAILDDITTGG